MLSLKSKILVSVAAVGLLSTSGLATIASAQDSYMPEAQQQQVNVTDQQLQDFAAAQAAVDQIQTQFQQQAADAQTQAELTAMQQQANEQMVEAIQQTGLKVEEYNQIATAVQSDPQIQQKYLDLLQ